MSYISNARRAGTNTKDRWYQLVRWTVFARSGGYCERCYKEPATQVHHIRYPRDRREEPHDLMAVCNECHCKLHGIPVADNDNDIMSFDFDDNDLDDVA